MSNALKETTHLSEEAKRALLANLLRQKAGQSKSLPLSFAQQRLWFLDQLDPGNPAYNMTQGLRLAGALKISVLKQAIQTIVERHETLRTTFSQAAGEPRQVIAPTGSITVPLIDLSDRSEAEREAEMRRLAAVEAERPFNLARGPLLRLTLFKLGQAEHVLLLSMHHIISDGWSLSVFWEELSALYQAYVTNNPASLPNLPIQYADFARWQRAWLQGPEASTGSRLQSQLAYWQAQLGGKLPVLQLPTDRPRPAVQTFHGARQSFTISAGQTEALKALCRQESATLFMGLLALFKLLLFRYTHQGDILVGSPVAGRHRREVEGLIGFFVNTLVFRTQPAADWTFRELLRQVRQVALAAYRHQDLPFEQLVESLRPERNLSHSPLFQVMFVLQNTPPPVIKLADVRCSLFEAERETAKFELTLSLEENGAGLSGWLEYNTDLFDDSTISRMIGHLQMLLAGATSQPEQPLSELPLLTAAERQQLLVTWNDTAVDYPPEVCLPQLFEAQVERSPDVVAVVFEEQQLTYRQLNERANQLAHYLQKLGVGPETLTGVCMERSLEMVIALYGILKAGGAYVPLDPTYPPERLAFMLADSQTPVLLTQARLRDSLPEYEGQIICLDAGWEAIAAESRENPASDLTADNLAYVIYTSGSTGRPKGAMNTQRAICNRLLWMQEAYRLEPGDRVLQKTPFSFDVSVWEFFWPLLNGAGLVVARPEGHKDSAYLIEVITGQQITTLHFVPSMLHIFLEAPDVEKCTSLRRVICSGEALPFELQERFFARLSAELHNLYGPTEAAIDVTYWACRPHSQRRIVPIGRPIANMQIYLLDDHLQPVPIGIPGELHIGGVGLARGYLNRPELTAEKFIPHPFSDEPQARLYKTGDLARYRPDGAIEYLGRLDHQVKLRGFRIELEEIESMLNRHPQVREAVALIREDRPGDKRLVTYLAAEPSAAPMPGELRRYLAQKLPDYMIPAALVVLESFPLTPNGKINRRALPPPDPTRIESPGGYVAPGNAVEHLLAEAWAKVLGLERVGAHDDFFALGGHSLQVAQLVAQVRQIFQIELPMRDFFKTATVAGLAQAIQAARRPQLTSTATGNGPALEAEVVLDETIRPRAPWAPPASPTAIFLTGATGFLGTFLLAEILQQTQADVYCLVRAADIEAGRQRLQHSLEMCRLWREEFKARIKPISGDLSQPYFGLARSQFEKLANLTDLIYHNGANVNFVYPYRKLKPVNVLGTQEVLRLATAVKTIPLHYISTLSVFSSVGYFKGGVIDEETELAHSEGLFNGYAQSKWVAEKLVSLARARGVPASIYRPGSIVGDSGTGIWKSGDYLTRFIKGCLQLGSMPDLNDVWYLVPVDYVSQAIIYLSQQPQNGGRTFHVTTAQALSTQELAAFIQSLGYSLRLISYPAWQTELLRLTVADPKHELYPLLPLFVTPISAETPLTIPEMHTPDKEPEFNHQNLQTGLAGSGIVCPAANRELLETYFSYFIRSGYLSAP